jgi:hypothetical protein
MFTNHELLTRIEDAWRVTPTCRQCGQPTMVVVRDGRLWAECPSLATPRGRVQSLLRLDFASFHTRLSIADLGEAA